MPGLTMAEIVAGFGVPHTPLLWRLMAEEIPPDLTDVHQGFTRVRQKLADIAPDVIVMVASDHFHQFSHAAMPALSIGNADVLDGTHPNEVRSFALPTVRIPGHRPLATALLGRETLAGTFDFAFSNRPVLDHAYVVPLLYTRPEMDIPVVPIHTNTNAPPLPPAHRFLELGRHIAHVVHEFDPNLRVVVVATGHLAYELGTASQFQGQSTDPAFDADAVAFMRSDEIDEVAGWATFDRMLRAGNLSFQYLNFLTLAAAMGRPASAAMGVECRFGAEPFFEWDPT